MNSAPVFSTVERVPEVHFEIRFSVFVFVFLAVSRFQTSKAQGKRAWASHASNLSRRTAGPVLSSNVRVLL